MARKSSALRRSFDVYYRDAERTRRMDALNAQFVTEGCLAFDIGAHVGDRTASFLRLGASVIALEPQPHVFRALRLIHGRNPKAVLKPQAAGAVAGMLDMYLNTQNPTISTVSRDLIAAAQTADSWRGQDWDAQTRVEVTKLDQLIAAHGRPDFVKIDVEGFEAEVLNGLSVTLPMLSFEFTTIQRDVAFACLDRLNALGNYKFNISLGEDHALRADWITATQMRSVIEELPDAANSGDVYARLAR